MSDANEFISMEGMDEVIAQLDFLDSTRVNDDYLKPAMKTLGSQVKKVEQGHIPMFTSKTSKSLTSKISTNGIGSVTMTIGPQTNGKNARLFVFRFISGGAHWHDRGQEITTWRGKERNRNARSAKKEKSGGKANPSFVPATALVAWVKKKLGESEEEAIHVAFRVAKTIGQRGLSPKPIVPPTLQEVGSMVVDSLNATIRRMLEEIKNGK